MRYKFQNILKYIWRLVLFIVLIIIMFFLIDRDLLNHKFCNWVATFIDHHNGQIRPEFEISLLILNLLISGVIALATCVYLIVTWRLLVNARKEHKENQRLTQKIHSDSLTPYIYLEEIEYALIITSKSNPDIRAHKVDVDKENETIKINSQQNLFSIDDIIVKGTIRLIINNASTNIADSSVGIYGIWNVIKQNDFIQPGATKEFIFNVNAQLKNTSNLLSLLSNKESIRIIVSAKGPGCSAQDKFEVEYFIKKNEREELANLDKEGWVYKERSREYV